MENETKNVGLMTWYHYLNYGSLLQAYALFAKVGQLGYQPMFIDYKPRKNRFRDEEYYLAELVKKAGRVLRRQTTLQSSERKRLFEAFIDEYFVQTQECNSAVELRQLNGKMDAFICGSDQIWAPSCFDENYYLSFVKNPEQKIAYAPSIGLTGITDRRIKERMGELLKEYKHLSIRELQGQELLRKMWGYEAEVVLDPTLLFTAGEWDRLLNLEEKRAEGGKKYLLCYFLGNPGRYMRYVKKIARKEKLDIYCIPVFDSQKRGKTGLPLEAGPKEFVEWIRGASYVCTDSFHGMAFSINYQIPFTVFERFREREKMNQNSRIYSLLHILGMESRIFQKSTFLKEGRGEDFSKAEYRLKEERKKSLAYLQNALKEAVEAKEPEREKRIPKQKERKQVHEEYVITEYCCGCGSCAAVCPKDVIDYVRNEKGFWHYRIDQSGCIHCGQCRQVCPFWEVDAPGIGQTLALYAAKSKRKEVLSESSSGGIAHELAEQMLEQDGAVWGCGYNRQKQQAEHIRVEKENRTMQKELQGSKYIQSSSWEAVKQLVTTSGSKELFIGTPCQVAGADKLLRRKKKREKYLLVDIICHGVPTQHLWNKYLKEIAARKKTGEHPKVRFRDKAYGWRNRTISILGNNRKYAKNQYRDEFYSFFRLGQCYMESCYECPYRARSSADIRIGDYWGKRFIREKEGVSMVLALTGRGKEAIKALEDKEKIALTEYEKEEYWSVQFPSNPLKPIYYEELLQALKTPEYGLKEIRKRYCRFLERRELLGRGQRFLYRFLKR